MEMLNKMKHLYELQKEAKATQKELSETLIEIEGGPGNQIKVTIDGEQNIKSVSIAEVFLSPGKKEEIEEALRTVLQKAITRSRETAAQRLKTVAEKAGLSGLMSRM